MTIRYLKAAGNNSNNQHILNTPIIGRRCRANGTPCHIQHSPNTPTTGLRERGNDTSKSTGRSGRQKAATRRNMRREERVTVQGPVKEQPDGMSHRGGLMAGGLEIFWCTRIVASPAFIRPPLYSPPFGGVVCGAYPKPWYWICPTPCIIILPNKTIPQWIFFILRPLYPETGYLLGEGVKSLW